MSDNGEPVDLQMRRLEAMLSPKNRKIVRNMKPGMMRRILTAQLVPGWLLNKKPEQKDKPAKIIRHPNTPYEIPDPLVFTIDGEELKWPVAEQEDEDDN